MWCIPPKQSAEFVYHMEDVLKVYQQPLDPQRPVVCADETFRQLIGEVREPLPVQPGAVERYDSVYVRTGVASLFLAFEPLTGWRHVAVTDTRKRGDWAHFVRRLEIHHTPKHGSWLNMAEIEFSVLARDLPERTGTRALLEQRIGAWEQRRNRAGVKADWQFTTSHARIKLRKLYPTVED
jgi:hypothetical protein